MKTRMSFVPDTNPDVLEWARKVTGLRTDAAAEAIGVDHLALQLWEAGYEGPTFNQLRRMADVYKKPVATLLRSALPKNEKPIEGDWRLLVVNQDREWSPELWLVQRGRSVPTVFAALWHAFPAKKPGGYLRRAVLSMCSEVRHVLSSSVFQL